MPRVFTSDKINSHNVQFQFLKKCQRKRQSAIYWHQTITVFPLSKKFFLPSYILIIPIPLYVGGFIPCLGLWLVLHITFNAIPLVNAVTRMLKFELVELKSRLSNVICTLRGPICSGYTSLLLVRVKYKIQFFSSSFFALFIREILEKSRLGILITTSPKDHPSAESDLNRWISKCMLSWLS